MKIIKLKAKSLESNSIIGHLLNYLSGDILVKGLAFLTIPIFTRMLSTEEYGVFSLFNTSIQIAMIILSLGIAAGIGRYYFEEDRNFSYALGSNLIFINIFIVFLVVIVFFFPQVIPLQSDLIIYLLIASYFSVFFDIYQKYLMNAKLSKQYRNTLVIHNVLFYGLAIALLFVIKEDKYNALIYSKTVAFLVIGVYALFHLIKISKINFQKEHLVYTLKYSIPLLPAILSNFVLVQFDRYAIQDLTNSMSKVGIYSFAYNVGMILNTFIVAITNSWRPYFYEKMNKNDFSGLGDMVKRNTKLVLLASLFFLLFSKEIVIVMADKEYYEALQLIPVIIISYIFIYFYTVYFQYLSYAKKTILISVNATIAAVVNIILNYIFIPIYGYMAAAYTTLVSYIILFLLTYILSSFVNKGEIIKFNLIQKDLISLLLFYFSYLFIFDANISNIILLIGSKVLILIIATWYFLKFKGVSN